MNKLEKINEIKTKRPFGLIDIIIAAVLIIISVSLIIFIPDKKGAYAEVYVDNNLVLKQNLNVNYEKKIYTGDGKHYNVIKIENGYVYIIDADCGDKTCIHMGKTNSKNKSIICLPHNLKITVTDSDDGIDTII